ncbi:outer membrane protein assembly factor BamB family protein [Tautonia rosea]|uniref:outer membrane protein assembly factor BamB family protein n=1 Tax=Tautonia rosea TaxID=2728037 RepID=UPI0014739925|nr:PQQ-binding-like beta-propeller repeat protein [Tautonia rosea]
MTRRFRQGWVRSVDRFRNGLPSGRTARGWAVAAAGLFALLLASGPETAIGQVMMMELVAAQPSNEEPGRPIQLPPASTEVKEALDDFERFARRSAWERAFKALDGIPDEQNERFVDRDDGFIIRVSERRRGLLASLPPEGREAYRLFADAEAQRLLDLAVGEQEEETLERLFASSFLTSSGDDAADRLGDLRFQQGRFDRAAECWLAILRDYPDSDLPPAQIAVKAALALHRAGRASEVEELRRDIEGRYAGEEVVIAGSPEEAETFLDRVLDEPEPEDSASADPSKKPAPVLGATEAAAWQVRFGDSVVAGMTEQEQQQWRVNPLSLTVPGTATDGSRLFVNYLSYLFAVDLTTGKMLWRSAPFHDLNTAVSQNQGRMIDPSRYLVVAVGDRLLSLERDLRDQNYNAPFRLVCRRSDSGDVVWQSTDLSELAGLDLIGPPLPVGDRVFVVGRTFMNQQPQQGPGLFVLAIQPSHGKVLWKAEVGTLRQDQQRYYYGVPFQEAQPQLVHRGGAVFLDTHAGVLVRLDAETGDLAWGYAYETDPVSGSGGRVFVSSNRIPDPVTAAGRPVEVDGALLVKGAKSGRIAAIDPDRMTLRWDRPMARSARLLGAVEGSVILGGPEVDALDVDSRRLEWSIRLPGGSYDGRPIIRNDGIWHLTPRGIFELDSQTGRVRRIVRGDDTGSIGGDLLLTDCWLLAVSNRTISAYERRPGEDDLDSNLNPNSDDAQTTDEGEQ